MSELFSADSLHRGHGLVSNLFNSGVFFFSGLRILGWLVKRASVIIFRTSFLRIQGVIQKPQKRVKFIMIK